MDAVYFNFFLPLKDNEGCEKCLFETMIMGVDHCIEFCTVLVKNGDPHKLRDLRVTGLPCAHENTALVNFFIQSCHLLLTCVCACVP